MPDWKDMPDPISIVNLSWEDLYETALSMDHKPTRKDMIDMMENIDCTDFDCTLDFWQNCEIMVRKYYDD